MSGGENNHKKLGWFLCWAVVFADIGTSLYYVPGILFNQVNNLAGLFVIMTSVVFVLLVLKYIEITDRYPEGGGVVTVATKAFGPWFGALGGMFIIVDYFLTASISAISGFSYLNSIINIASFIGVLAIIGLIFLGILNVIGISESAKVTAVVASVAFIIDIILVVIVGIQIKPEGWRILAESLTKISTLGPLPILTGFAGSFLAFSGLESISQLSPDMRQPRKKIAGIAMGLVIITILLTSPVLTLFSTNLLTAKADNSNETIIEQVSKIDERTKQLETTTDETKKQELQQQISRGKDYSNSFISELGAQYGGNFLKVAIIITASILLLFASNTAIIGAYHVFIALAKQKFLPGIFLKHNSKFDSPHWAILLAVSAPILIIIGTRGDINLLGELYAFGLLGAFSLTSLGLDVVRWKEKKININFVVGILTTVLILIAWLTNLYFKQLATLFGGTITLTGMIIAFFVRRKLTRTSNNVSGTLVEKNDSKNIGGYVDYETNNI